MMNSSKNFMNDFMNKWSGTYPYYSTDNSSCRFKYTITTNTSSNTTKTIEDQYTIIDNCYIPFKNNYVYDTFVITFNDDINGLRDFIYCNNLFEIITESLMEIYEEGQDFEDNLYRNVLDLLFDLLDLSLFPSIYDYSDTEFNKIMQEIINHFKDELEKEM